MPESNLPYIPETITVHLGNPDDAAENVTLPFIEYVKNVASSEIFPTWPENALRANIYVIVTYALNRIFTEWYRSRGYDFDITNTTRYDQAFVKGRETFENINFLVDDLFSDYIVRQGNIQPLFASFCNGTTSTCAGLSQWGTVSLAENGLSPYEILQNYYGDDINIVMNAPVRTPQETYPGVPLRTGTAGNDVNTIQAELNRIRRNYPAIPQIQNPNGIFAGCTESAVREFQTIFNLDPTGVVDKATWYKIKQIHTGVTKLAELAAEGLTAEEVQPPFPTQLSQGMQGTFVRILQYFLNIISYFNSNLAPSPTDGIYGEETAQAVRQFQTYYGLPATGVVNTATWDRINTVYIDTVSALPQGYSGRRAKYYPGYFLTLGLRNEDVRDLQTYLSLIGRNYREIPEIPVTGYYGEQTRDAVYAFQRLFGIPITGSVGPATWGDIARQYDFIIETEELENG